mgnify:CR=1 FL=1
MDHVRTHLSVRLYDCHHCGKAFTWVANRNRHIKVCGRNHAKKPKKETFESLDKDQDRYCLRSMNNKRQKLN